jgi:predicted DNA-binding mobile mystery protein A
MRASAPINQLGRWALEIRFRPLRKLEDTSRPSSGWIKVIRQVLGMTTGQLAKRIGVAQSRITALEKAEANDAVTLKTLRHAAEGLNCTLVYFILPNEPLDKMLTDRARMIADEQLARTHHTMKLENQGVEPRGLKMARERLIEDLLKDGRRLWDRP